MGIFSGSLGTLIGGGAGFLVGGPMGAAIGASIGSGLDQANAADEAAKLQQRGTTAGIAEQRRQFDITNQQLQPFLQAATGSGGALNQLMAGIDQAPQVPNLPGVSTQAPQLTPFQFDPTNAMNNPAIQFQMQQGQQQIDRIAGRNRGLGSGQRLVAAQEFGQGLASQALGEEFNRQMAQNQSANQVGLQNFGINRELEDTGINRLLQQYGLTSDAYNQRLNRLSGIVDVGRGTGTALGQMGQQSSGNIANLMQAGSSAAAAGRLGQTNALLGGLQQGLGLYAMSGGFGGGSPAYSLNAPQGGTLGYNSGGYGGTGMGVWYQ